MVFRFSVAMAGYCFGTFHQFFGCAARDVFF
jgi:hypothetical protein